MDISVIIPVYNGARTLGRCLEGLAASSRPPAEVLVVDDGSTDDSASLAALFGAKVIPLPGGPHGPARARNHGAAAAAGEVLVFLDADAVVHPDTLARMERYLREYPETDAVFGSYDPEPPADGTVSRFKNLFHHFVHQHSQADASTFWAGCGAIRRSVFQTSGGFDESYSRPAVEDIELGLRLKQAGHRLRLLPEVQVTHLKHWTLATLLASDIRDRAIPWTRLIICQGKLPNDLNLNSRSRFSAMLAWTGVATALLGFWHPQVWIGFFLAAMILGLLNADLYRFFACRGGLLFAGGAALLHTLYLLYSSLIFILWAAPAWLAGRGLILLLLATLCKGLLWSIVIPPWHTPDEQLHFLYAQTISRQHTLHVPPLPRVPLEARELWELTQCDTVRGQSHGLDLSDRVGIAQRLVRLTDPKIKQTYLTYTYPQFGLNPLPSYHPPLYYAALTPVQRPLESASILVRVLACRWFTVLLGVGTVFLAYLAGLLLWPGKPRLALLLGILVSFQPMLTFCAARVGNDALEIMLFSSCLVMALRVAKSGLTWGLSLILGVTVGLGLLTKISFLSFLPLLFLLLAWDMGRSVAVGRLKAKALGPWLLTICLPTLLSGWWYKDTVLSGGNNLVSCYGTIGRHSVGLFSFLANYHWQGFISQILLRYWGVFGWVDTPMPIPLLHGLMYLTGLIICLMGCWFFKQTFPHGKDATAIQIFSFLYLGCATLSIIMFYVYLDYRLARDLGGNFGMQGRYFLPGIVGQMAWAIQGLLVPIPSRLRPAWIWLLGLGMVALNIYALVAVIIPRYYGTRILLSAFEQATVLQPVGLAVTWTIFAAFILLSLMLLASLWGTRGEPLLSPHTPHSPVSHLNRR